ncbi:uncharacterized protein BJ212DRAFT_1351054 [Suillus subaureus]|uniref:Uncharacterized protein n=1 Tax=Suillus subaureus TaxID=48587 RepID=A0A9P7EBM8_9AGAM|nr:uncharacterized protein BJ212DRAFT_1351054 [Suillus subaureus]KAG1817130.1 hypothetical protein BJ212DRAFT_1351054 [Suillus subaureus]
MRCPAFRCYRMFSDFTVLSSDLTGILIGTMNCSAILVILSSEHGGGLGGGLAAVEALVTITVTPNITTGRKTCNSSTHHHFRCSTEGDKQLYLGGNYVKSSLLQMNFHTGTGECEKGYFVLFGVTQTIGRSKSNIQYYSQWSQKRVSQPFPNALRK